LALGVFLVIVSVDVFRLIVDALPVEEAISLFSSLCRGPAAFFNEVIAFEGLGVIWAVGTGTFFSAPVAGLSTGPFFWVTEVFAEAIVAADRVDVRDVGRFNGDVGLSFVGSAASRGTKDGVPEALEALRVRAVVLPVVLALTLEVVDTAEIFLGLEVDTDLVSLSAAVLNVVDPSLLLDVAETERREDIDGARGLRVDGPAAEDLLFRRVETWDLAE
jgi:hypothetical protein